MYYIMVTKEWARYLSDEEIKQCYNEYTRRKRGGKQETNPSDLEASSPNKISPEQASKDLNIFSP